MYPCKRSLAVLVHKTIHEGYYSYRIRIRIRVVRRAIPCSPGSHRTGPSRLEWPNTETARPTGHVSVERVRASRARVPLPLDPRRAESRTEFCRARVRVHPSSHTVILRDGSTLRLGDKDAAHVILTPPMHSVSSTRLLWCECECEPLVNYELVLKFPPEILQQRSDLLMHSGEMYAF